MPDRQIDDSFLRLKNTTKYIAESPGKAAWRAALPFDIFGGRFLGFGSSGFGKTGKRDDDLYRTLLFLSLIGFNKEIESINEELQKLDESSLSQDDKKNILSRLNEIFCILFDTASLAVDQEKKQEIENEIRAQNPNITEKDLAKEMEKREADFQAIPDAVLKQLKKRIHSYAEKNNLPKMIVNTKKQAKHKIIDQRMQKLPAIGNGYAEIDRLLDNEELDIKKIKSEQQLIKKQRKKIRQTLTDEVIDEEVTFSNQRLNDRRADYIKRIGVDFDPGSKTSHRKYGVKWSLTDKDLKKINKRKKRKEPDAPELTRENYSLSHKTASAKKSLRRWKRGINVAATLISLIVCIGEGVVPAVLAGAGPFGIIIGVSAFIINIFLFRNAANFTMREIVMNKLYKDKDGKYMPMRWRMLLTLSGTSCILGGAAFGMLSFATASTLFPPALAVVLAAFTATALAFVFYVGCAQIIKNREAIKDYFKERFVDQFKQGNYGKLGLNFAALVITAAATIAVGVISFVFFRSKTADFMLSTAHCAPLLADKLSIIINGLAAIPNFIFNANNLNKLVNKTFTFLKNPAQAIRNIKKAKAAGDSNPIRRVYQIGAMTQMVGLYGCMGLNAYGQGCGPIKPITALSNSTVGLASGLLFSVNSSAPHAFEVKHATTDSIPGDYEASLYPEKQSDSHAGKSISSSLSQAGFFKGHSGNEEENESQLDMDRINPTAIAV